MSPMNQIINSLTLEPQFSNKEAHRAISKYTPFCIYTYVDPLWPPPWKEDTQRLHPLHILFFLKFLGLIRCHAPLVILVSLIFSSILSFPSSPFVDTLLTRDLEVYLAIGSFSVALFISYFSTCRPLRPLCGREAERRRLTPHCPPMMAL